MTTTPQALEHALEQGLTRQLVEELFLPAPKWSIPLSKRQAFEKQFDAARELNGEQPAPYVLPYPKAEFLRYLVTEHDMLLHGSNQARIAALMPRPQTDFSGAPVRGIFATADAIWPIFFAILDRESFSGSMRNGCFVAEGAIEKRFYFFSVNRSWLAKSAWMTGTIYVLPRGSFVRTDSAPVHFDEWVSERPVQPIMKLQVDPSDFPFLAQVAGHSEDETIYESWANYKQRIANTGAVA